MSLTIALAFRKLTNPFELLTKKGLLPSKKASLAFLELTSATVASFLLTFISYSIVYNLVVTPTPNSNLIGISQAEVNSTIKVNFDQPVSRKNLQLTIDPPIEGSWVAKSPLFATHLYRTFEFQPRFSLDPNTTYSISIKNIAPILGKAKSYDFQFGFTTKPLPTIAAVNFGKDHHKVSPTQIFAVRLNSANKLLTDYQFSFSPPIAAVKTLSADQTVYLIRPLVPLKQGQTYRLVAKSVPVKFDFSTRSYFPTGNDQIEQQLSFTTANPPSVSFSSNGDSASTGPITLSFNKAMNKETVGKNLTFLPQTQLSFNWLNEKTLQLVPTQALPFKTRYSIRLTKDTKAADSTFFEQDVNHSFTTLGEARVISFNPPPDSSVGVDSSFSATFDQPVDQVSAQSHFSIFPSVKGSFSWSENTLTFKPNSSFAFGQTYSIKLAAGIKSLTALDSIFDFTSTFTTQPQIVRLRVPAYRQFYKLSCEFASMRMMLAYRGIYVSEQSLIAQTPFDTTPHIGNTWGDPDVGFVGDINGQMLVTGYGVYMDIIASVLNKYRPSQSFHGWNLTSLLNEVKAGNPVMIRGCSTCNGPVTWVTPGGKTINAFSKDHVFVVKGFVGTPDNPSSIIVNDSLTGGETIMSRSLFMSKWAANNYSAVVLR